MKKNKLTLFFLLCFGVPVLLWGQETKQLADKMENIFRFMRPQERKLLVENYVSLMSSSFLSAIEKEQLDSVFSELQDLYVTVNPELQNYVHSVNSFGLRQEKENLMVWLQGLQQVLRSSGRKRIMVKAYLESTVYMATGQVLFYGSGHQWQVKGKVNWQGGNPLYVEFQDNDLWCFTRRDTIRIFSGRGKWKLGEDFLDAKGGMVKWNNSADEISAQLSHYRINLKMSGYTADSVRFDYESKYHRPLWGTLKDNALKDVRPKDPSLPEFTSYNTDVEIRDIFENVHFRGGVTYKGRKFSGTGTVEHPAFLHIIPSDSISMKLYSTQFLFDTARVLSGHAAMEIVLDSGMITHADINFLYAAPQHVVTIKRISERSMHLPFKDSYHRILFDMEEIYWPVGGDYMEMRMSSRTGLFKATIESMNFFSDQVYDRIQGMDEINPLNGLLKCSLELRSNTFTLGEYADFLKKPIDQLRRQIVLLSYDDFLDYNEMRDEVTLKQRLFDYTKARIGKQDYDNIRFTSLPGKNRVNAVMNVRNYNLKIMGVEKFMISEARNIYVVPADKEVVMMKNRDMAFNGKLNAGMFDMYGQNLFFSYDKYTISLPKVDSASMYMAGADKNVRGRKVNSLIRDITGEIIIDKPDNKSGIQENPGFPVLNSAKESYVYFDDPSVHQGQYKRDSFYYKIDPYSVKGINDVSRFRYAFSGTLVSNIVAPIKDTIRLMPDNTLGLTYQTPATGLELYGKGRIYSRITLNRKGFIASGRVNLNQSDFNSDTILMLPGQMSAHTHEIKVEAVKDQRPGMQGKDVQISYIPYTGSLLARSVASPFEMYHGRIKHEGTMKIYENLLDASGKMFLEGAELQSGLIHCKPEQILSAKAALNIASVLNKDIHLNTSDVKAIIDLSTNTGKFVNNGGGNRLTFSSSQYHCSFENFTWYMKETYLNIGMEEQEQLAKVWKLEQEDSIPAMAKNRFVSSNRLLDSLNFIVPLARYDLKSGDIACRWVNHIDVANGRFYPAKGEMDIQANGDIQEFEDGRLLCERTDPAKLLTAVKFKLKGKNDFNGSGNYLYVSEEKKKSVLHFMELGRDSAKLIFAKAQVKAEEPLYLNNGIRFKGNVVLYSRKPDLWFAGYAGLTTDTVHVKHNWVRVQDYLASAHIRIPLKIENRNDKQQRIYNAIYLNTDKSFTPYASFMSSRRFYNDDLLIGGEGKLEWSLGMKQYIISDTLCDKYYRFRYDPEIAVISSFGPVTPHLNIPGVDMRMAGDISFQLKTEKLHITDVLLLTDFTLLNRMEAVILKDFGDKKLKNIKVEPSFKEKLTELYGQRMMPALEKQLTNMTFNIPDSLHQLFVMDSLSFVWNEQIRSYVADGGVYIVAIKGKPIGKNMKIKMELLRSRSGNQYFMYIYDDNMWYYFEYADRNLYTFSSNEEYNEIIKSEKADKKVIQTQGKETLYTITLCPASKKERFLKRIKD